MCERAKGVVAATLGREIGERLLSVAPKLSRAGGIEATRLERWMRDAEAAVGDVATA